MVTRFNSISTRKLTKAILILTCDKSIVAMSDYGETHKLMKKCILNSLLGANAQKRHRVHRDIMIKNIINCLYDEVKSDPGGAVNLISFFKNELFRLAFKQALGRDVEPIYVEELGMKLSESQMFDILVVHPVMGLIEVDWRDFFPYLRWIPNKSMELKVQKMAFQRNAVMKALVEEQKKRIKSGEHKDCYLDFLLAEAETLTEKQVLTMVWEAIFEISDTTMVTTEWAMFELARNIKCQDRLYQEIKEICGSDKITEEHLPKLHYLNAVFHETLRRHSPLPVLPPRYVHEDIELGGFHIAAGSEAAKEARFDKEYMIKFFRMLIRRRYFFDDQPPQNPWSVRPVQKSFHRSGEDLSDDDQFHKHARCNFLNFASNIWCLECKEDGPKSVDFDEGEMKIGDWTCLQCQFMNFARNTKCLRCQKSRPKRPLNPEEWECSSLC